MPETEPVPPARPAYRLVVVGSLPTTPAEWDHLREQGLWSPDPEAWSAEVAYLQTRMEAR